MSKEFFEAIRNRRSIYGLSDEVIVSEAKIEEIIQETLMHAPSAFNSQSTRIVLLFHEQSKKLWDLTLAELKKIVSAEQFVETQNKINGSFASGYGTVLFFEDQEVIDTLVDKFTSYADRFPLWGQQTNAIHQYIIWTALEAEGLGASLQHYNPIIDEAIQKEWNISSNWRLIAQIPFGKPVVSASEKEHMDINQRFKVFK